MFEEAFREPAQAGRPILCIVLSSKVSGTINAAQTAAKSFPDAKIVVYDSESAAGGLQLLVMRARELALLGRSVDQICETLDRERKTQRLYACLADLSHVQRTGRIGRAQAAIGTLMKIVPVLRFKDGAVEAEAQVRTFARAQETMLDLGIAATPDPANARYVVLHTHAPAAAEAARDRLRSKLGGVEPKSLEIVEAGPVIATHAGPGAVGLAVSQQ
jgi:DegV family protein with EDD domain